MKRHIFCLETTYDQQLEKPLSMLPVLELLEKVLRVRHIHFNCNTLPEFKWNLKRFRARANFQVLYLAGHGTTNTMQLANGELVDLKTLGELMGQHFDGWTVHLGGCSTIIGSNNAVRAFMAQTGVSMVTGYSKDVDWMTSAALEMLWFSELQSHDSFSQVWRSFRENHLELLQKNGMKAVLRD